ncbi:tRNA pseudouridine(38-40) synthase TruA [Propionivibrio limicola]|uniref:tRNA pseudouridine(38-40) synthase TruA n=1 Tax=Propionivibrio limicola TaxID=167645 RepID=UPI001290D061|nr:tRNA pseudouridine(38-40) synthase TruA [Propionivibrio limicola]
MRVALGVEYDGSDFSGWQKQPAGVTVQDALEAALEKIAGVPINVVCAGRTDAGVHATGQVVHFDTTASRPLTAWVRGVNTFLPSAVAVRWAQPVDEAFHARFSAFGRCYRYLLINRPQRSGVWHGRAGWYHHPLDEAVMQRAADRLLGEHDFSAFRAAECQAKSPIKTLRRADVRRFGDMVVFDFEASAFLHHMVRNMVGSLVYVGQGKHQDEWISELLASGDRRQAAPTFSAAGLYLAGVRYEAQWGLPVADNPFLAGGACF